MLIQIEVFEKCYSSVDQFIQNYLRGFCVTLSEKLTPFNGIITTCSTKAQFLCYKFAYPQQSYLQKDPYCLPFSHESMSSLLSAVILHLSSKSISCCVDHLAHRLTCSVQSAHTFHFASNTTPTFSCPTIRIAVVGG
jgi:hypothetical protein